MSMGYLPFFKVNNEKKDMEEEVGFLFQLEILKDFL